MLDFDVRFVWKCVGQPEPDENAAVLERSDFRIELGSSWKL